ncbi:hypothetical protein HMPREF0663_10007 [Hoylesella oralis ATCC 33269]|uniref:Uncharacterized protein n=1 Tax=Hoylesella oralis ATCC 33269 TaxID=873533 RepID=E7RLK7_9BACT|nr:hypothetical protein HMPREF0663_10007 [Hoylesella oralis ATCC 33269]
MYCLSPINRHSVGAIPAVISPYKWEIESGLLPLFVDSLSFYLTYDNFVMILYS